MAFDMGLRQRYCNEEQRLQEVLLTSAKTKIDSFLHCLH